MTSNGILNVGVRAMLKCVIKMIARSKKLGINRLEWFCRGRQIKCTGW
jgi:hypothetical protein